ncbi:hypothetical protein [Eudoraea chungangensis]|uniref:hypothetical protein n=1 Tax=Eudoraea chungangensis TaxID=1481905 RepID=UPI0023EAC8BF|nr:hypothetical protein [Eudoraea chungangensis]
MNSKLENFLLTKDYKDLSPQEKLYVSSFIKEIEYTEFRGFLKKSREAFRMEKATVVEPNINNGILLQSLRERYPIKKYASIKGSLKRFTDYSTPKYLALAATLVLCISILAVYINVKMMDIESDVATEYLLEGKETIANPKSSNEIYSPEVTNLYSKENDSLNRELDKMNEHLVIKTQGLDVEIINPAEEL